VDKRQLRNNDRNRYRDEKKTRLVRRDRQKRKSEEIELRDRDKKISVERLG
jgi:hypothetical protein